MVGGRPHQFGSRGRRRRAGSVDGDTGAAAPLEPVARSNSPADPAVISSSPVPIRPVRESGEQASGCSEREGVAAV